MKLYVLRAGKCLLKLAVLLAAVFLVMAQAGMLDTRGATVAQALFASQRGMMLMALVVIWAAVYPLMSFARASLRMDFDQGRQRLVDALASLGYALESEGDGRMTFRVRGWLRRALWQWDDRVTVSRDGGFVDIEGLKRIVPRIETRLKSRL